MIGVQCGQRPLTPHSLYPAQIYYFVQIRPTSIVRNPLRLVRILIYVDIRAQSINFPD